MKVIKIKNHIINCEEIRNVNYVCGFVQIYFRNSKSDRYDVSIETKSKKDGEELIRLIFEEMIDNGE